LLLETGGYLLFETGTGKLLLEDSVIVNKEQTGWAAGVDRLATSWAGDGFTTYTGSTSIQRIQQDGTVRRQQGDTIRLQQPSTATAKAGTAWSEL
jgi:hypothetical protein